MNERAGRILALAATLLLLGVGVWEIAAPFGAGHYTAATAVLTAGENMWRWGTLAPVTHYTAGPPAPSDYYCHHPFGIFWTAALFSLLGHHDWVCRLPAVLMSTAMPALLYRTGRALYGPIAGGLGALGFAVLPITLAYANFFALEVPAMFGMAVAVLGWVRFSQSGRRRFAGVFVLGLAYAAAADWPGFVFGGLVLGGLLVRGFFLRRWFPPLAFERFATGWATAASLLVLLGAFHVGAFAHLEKLDDFLRQGEFRAAGSELPWREALERRAYWIALAFTPLAVLLGKVAAPALLALALLRRRELELLPLAVLLTACFHYLVFKQGADIHFFWPHYFALYFGYALSALSAGAYGLLEVGLARVRRFEAARAASLAVLVLGGAVVLLVALDGLRALRYARKTGARFNEKGLLIHADFDKQAAVAAVARELPDDAVVGLSASMKQSYWLDWVTQRPVTHTPQPRAGVPFRVTHYWLDTRFESGRAARNLTQDFAVRAFGPYLAADLRAAGATLEGFALAPREPSFFERLFVSAHHHLYEVKPDAFWTWELREHYGHAPNPPPAGEPRRPEELRSAHNAALAAGDAGRAAALRARLLEGVDRRVGRVYGPSIELLGARFERGASDILTLYFVALAPLESDVQFAVTSTVEAPPRLSLTPRDELPWDVGMPFALPTSSWRPGFIYSSISELVRRPGRERYTGAFRGKGAETLNHGGDLTLLTLD